jgi:AcrR family transcriptional regulator
MDAIAAEAAITKPILYRTIGDKAALTFALSERFVDRLSVATAAAQQGVTEPRAQFRASVHAYLATIDEHRNMFLFVNGSEYGTPLFCRLVERSARDLVGWLTAVRTRAGLDPAGARSWAYAIVGSLQMVGTMWLRERTCTLDELADDLTRLMWDGLDRSIRVQREPPSDR